MDDVNITVLAIETKENAENAIVYMERKLLVNFNNKRFYITEQRWIGPHPTNERIPQSSLMLIKADKFILIEKPTDDNYKTNLIKLINA